MKTPPPVGGAVFKSADRSPGSSRVRMDEPAVFAVWVQPGSWPITKGIKTREFCMDALKRFGRMIADVWTEGLFGTDFGRYLIALLIFCGFLLIRRVLARWVSRRLKSLTRRTATRLDDDMLDAVDAPLQFVPVVLGAFLALEYLGLAGSAAQMADRVVRSLVVFAIFWGLLNLVHPLSFMLQRLEKVFTPSLVEWLRKAINAALIFIGVATVLEIWGIQIGPIIAGLGLFGVAVALGAQDLFKNLIAGLLIIAERRFNPGDWIRVDGAVEGTVESIGFRSTRIRRFDMAPMFVPNTQLSDQSLVNFSAMTHRRIHWVVGLEYRTRIDQLRAIRNGIERYLQENDDFAGPPAVPLFVRIDRFSDSSIDILVYCFTHQTAWGRWLEIKEALALRIKEIVEDAGAGFAFPSQSIYVESLPEQEPPEVFRPPDTGGAGETKD